MDAVPRLVGQVGVLAGLGLSLWGIRHAMRRTVHPDVAACGIHELDPGVADALSRLVELEPGAVVVLHDATRVLELALEHHPENQWRIARLNAAIVRDARAVCAHSHDPYVTEDVLPSLEGALDDVLHNHLLDHHHVSDCGVRPSVRQTTPCDTRRRPEALSTSPTAAH
jgi:hypothetical protein